MGFGVRVDSQFARNSLIVGWLVGWSGGYCEI